MRLQAKRIFCLIIGAIVVGVGIGMMLKSGIGSDPLGIFCEGISRHFPITVGNVTLLANALMLIGVVFIDRKQIYFGTLIVPVISSLMIDFTLAYFPFTPTNFIQQLIVSLSGIVILSIFAGMYMSANYGKAPYDGLILGIAIKTKTTFAKARIPFDVCFLIAGYLLGGTVGVGTVLALILIGTLVNISLNFFLKRLYPPINS